MKHDKWTYRRALAWHALVMVCGLISGHLLAASSDASRGVMSAAAALVAVVPLALGARSWWRDNRDVEGFLTSTAFIVTNLTVLTLTVILGTLVLQQLLPAQFEGIYGAAAGALRLFFLEDLFHALWFKAVIALQVLSLVVIAIQRWPWTWRQIGYVCAHLGIVVSLLGAVIGQLGGVKGRLDLVQGKASDRLLVRDWRLGRAVAQELPFSVRLDDFKVEMHENVYRAYVFEHRGGDDYRAILSIDPEEERGKRVPIDSAIGLKVEEYATRPTMHGAPTPASYTLVLGDQSHVVEPGQRYEDLGGLSVAVGEFFPHFNYDISAKRATNASSEPRNPALQITLTPRGATEPTYHGWVFANMPGFSMKDHGGEDQAPPVFKYRPPSGAGAGGGPQLTLAVLRGEQEIDRRTLTFTGGGESSFAFGDGRYIVSFRLRKGDPKNYYSLLSVLQGGAVVHSERIYVNAPMKYDGYYFYQSNYDPENLRYSGIDVVRDPGLWLVYLGLVMMLFGVLQIFYLRSFRFGRAAQGAAS